MSALAALGLAAALVTSPGAEGGPAALPSEWQLVERTADGIDVLRRERSGSPVEEVKGTILVAAPPSAVYAAAMDEGTYAALRDHTEVYRTIHTPDRDVWFVYQRVRHALVSRRDLTLRYETEPGGAPRRYRISWHAANENGPPPMAGVIRVAECAGELTIDPLGSVIEGRRASTRITYLNHTDPGGRIPHWAVDLVSRHEVPVLLRALRDAALGRAVREPR
jgi:hypothetical protein